MSDNHTRVSLRAGALGLIGAGTLGAVMLSPALGIYGNFAALEGTAGVVTSLVFLIAMVIALPTGVSYAMVAKEMPAAGSAYTWLWRATHPRLGSWVGWLMTSYYVVVIFLQPVIFGLFFNELLAYAGLHTSNWTYLLGVVAATILVAPAVYRNVTVTARSALVFLLFEMATIIALTITIFVVQARHGHFSASPFNPAAATGGWSAISRAVLFGILAFTGFDIVSTVAEETKTPKSLIPLATIISLLMVGAFWVVTSWAFSIAVPASKVAALASSGVTPITPIASIYWHRWDIIVTITGMTASLATYLAGMLTVGRVMFAMGRDHALPGWFSKLNPKFRTPWNALHVNFALVVIVTGVVAASLKNPYNVFIWAGEATVFFAVLTYFFVHLGNIVYYTRFNRPNFNWFLSGVVPVFGMIVLAYALYKAFFVSLWGAGFALGQSVIWFAVIWSVLGAVYLWLVSRARPDVFKGRSFVLDSDAPESAPAATSTERQLPSPACP
jgi:amino acid transporter